MKRAANGFVLIFVFIRFYCEEGPYVMVICLQSVGFVLGLKQKLALSVSNTIEVCILQFRMIFMCYYSYV